MNNTQLILPINNQYNTIEIEKLHKNNFKLDEGNSLKNKKIDARAILEIKKYSKKIEILNKNENKESLILDSKKVPSIPKPTKQTTSYFKKIDMLSSVKSQEIVKDDKMQTKIQKYIRTFTTLDINLAQDQHSIYEFKPKTFNSKILNKNVSKILEYSFFEMSSVISRPYFYVTPKNVIINLFYFVVDKKKAHKNFLNLNNGKLEGLSAKLSKFFNKPVNLELVQLYSISNNSQILAHIFGKLGLFRKSSFSRIISQYLKHHSNKIIFRSNNRLSKFATLLTGVNIKLGGRLMRGKIIPRRSVKKIQYGSLSRIKSNYITNARLTQKNKRGAFTFSVSIGHKVF